MPDWLIPGALPLIAAAAWLIMLTVLSYISGWRKLAAGYAYRKPFTGPKWRFQSAAMRWLGIRNCLIFGADERGLYMSMMLPFRFWHPPLLIPWQSVTAQKKKKLFSDGVEFMLGPPPGVRLWVWTVTAGKIRVAAGARFPGEAIL